MQTIDTKATLGEVREVVEAVREEKLSRRLDYVYRQVPANKCKRCTDCCFTGPQVHPAEFLNIYDAVLQLSELTQARLARGLVEYELLHMATLSITCPFLEETDCLIYDRMPLQCRTFGLYPPGDYERMRAESQEANEQMAMYFARNHRILLPQEVMAHDAKQCDNNIDEEGHRVLMGESERQHLHNQIFAVSEEILPEEWSSPDQAGFSTQYVELFFDSEDLDELRVKVIKEYQSGGKRTTLDKLLADSGLQF